MAVKFQIKNLNSLQPLFQEFCKERNLKDGDLHCVGEYLIWADRLSRQQQQEIISKYKSSK